MDISRAGWRRILPFAVFMVLLALRGFAPRWQALPFDPRWLYGLTLPVVGGMLLWWWREWGELTRQNLPTAAQAAWSVLIGVVVFGLWIHLDAPWMQIGESAASFVPLDAHGARIWPLITLRWIGASLVVPVMEELFWRSFLMRWLQQPDFAALAPQRVGARALLLSTFVFVLAHPLWLAAALAGLAYGALYIRTGRLWTAVLAHAVTNGLLGVWVVHSGQWQFW